MISTDLFVSDNAFCLGMANHLWQSTLFAALVWSITLFMKVNHARIRYWVWFSVTIKFLIPFSLLVNIGGMIAPELSGGRIEMSPTWHLIQTISRPFNPQDLHEVSPTLDIADSPSPADGIRTIILSIWLCGCLTVLLNWLKQTLRVAGIVRKAEFFTYNRAALVFQRIKRKSRAPDTVQLAFTQDTMEPGVFGIFRPVLLLPTGISGYISDEELETIILHEFAHIRFKDNFTASIHRLVESLFWFHPVVWFTGSKLVFERELACDESVLQFGGNPRIYAKGLLKVCEYYFKSSLSCVPGVIGSDLKKRLEGILKKQIGRKLSPAKKIFLSVAVLSVLVTPLLIGIVKAPSGQANISVDNWASPAIDTHTPKADQVAIKPEMNDASTGIIRAKENKNIPNVTNPVSMPTEGQRLSGEKNTEVETLEGQDRNSIKTVGTTFEAEDVPDVRKTVYGDDTEDNVLPAKKETPVKLASSIENKGTEFKTEDADDFIFRGVSCLKKGQLENAVSAFNNAIKLDQNKAVAYVARGSAYYRLDLLDKAIFDYNKAIEIDPDFAVAYQNRGSVYYCQEKYDNAISDYNRAIAINPGLSVTYHDRGSIYHSQNKFDEAISDYSRAIDLNPVFAVAYQNRGSAYYSIGKYKKAIADYSKAIDLNPRLGKTNDDQEIVCRMVAPTGSNIDKKICLTKAQWAVDKMDNGYQSVIAFK